MINDDVARVIKQRLIDGEKAPDIAKDLNIKYKTVNNILSSNTWSHVEVDGWNEFYNNRPKLTRATKEEAELFYKLYKQGNTIHKIHKDYNRSYSLVQRVIKEQELLHDNPVPSSE